MELLDNTDSRCLSKYLGTRVYLPQGRAYRINTLRTSTGKAWASSGLKLVPTINPEVLLLRVPEQCFPNIKEASIQNVNSPWQGGFNLQG